MENVKKIRVENVKFRFSLQLLLHKLAFFKHCYIFSSKIKQHWSKHCFMAATFLCFPSLENESCSASATTRCGYVRHCVRSTLVFYLHGHWFLLISWNELPERRGRKCTDRTVVFVRKKSNAIHNFPLPRHALFLRIFAVVVLLQYVNVDPKKPVWDFYWDESIVAATQSLFFVIFNLVCSNLHRYDGLLSTN